MSVCCGIVPGTPGTGDEPTVGPVPQGLASFYAQKLSWDLCPIYGQDLFSTVLFADTSLDCARLSVPLDYTNPAGSVAQLGVLRRKSTSPERIGAVVFNPGGPGVSGMVAAAGYAKDTWTGALREKFDLVGFDPRGVGASRPKVKCLSDREKDAERLEPPIEGADAVARIEQKNREFAGKCAAASGRDLLANVGTRDVARDVDILRAALGERKLTYLGYSYGTRIGTAYAEAFAGNVRAMVLDGVEDPNPDPATDGLGVINGFKEAFSQYATSCSAQKDCPVGVDPAKAEARLDNLFDPLKTRPLAVRGRELSYSDALIAVRVSLYSEQQWNQLTEGLRNLAAGNGQLLLRLADANEGRQDDGTYSGSSDAFTAVTCVDGPPERDRAVVEDNVRRIRAAHPPHLLVDERSLQPALDTCAFWPVPNTGTPHDPHVPGLPKVLVVSTIGDPVTPYPAGAHLATLLRAGLLTVAGTRHGGFLHGLPCVDKIVTTYLVSLQEPADHTTCS